jgi:hypothetical protein
MHIWKAALCILYELPEGESRRYTYITNAILHRGLAVSRSRKPAQTVGTILREHGRGHFFAEGNGYYRLGDRAAAAAVYKNMIRSYPHLFPASSIKPPIAEPSTDGVATRSSVNDSVTFGSRNTYRERKSISQTSRWDVVDLAAQIIPEQVPTKFEGV